MWERLSLPIEAVFGASAHPPQAPIWLDPSGCPPGRVFRFSSANQMSSPGIRWPQSRGGLMPACGLIVDSVESLASATAKAQAAASIRDCLLDFVHVFHENIFVIFD